MTVFERAFSRLVDRMIRGCEVTVILIGISLMSLPHTLTFGSQWLKKTVAAPVIRGEEGMCVTLTEPQVSRSHLTSFLLTRYARQHCFHG